MNRFLPLATAIALLSLVSGQAASTASNPKIVSDYTLSVYPDREDAIYKKGDKVEFQVLLLGKNPTDDAEVSWKVSKDGVPPIQQGKTRLKYGKAVIPASLDEPGFLLCEVSFNDGKQNLQTSASAAIDPTEIKPSMPTPDDFDAFWDGKKAELAKIPINPRLTPVETPPDRPGVETFDVQLDCLGKPVSGFYSRPIGAKPGSCPALLLVDGAGVRSTDKLWAIRPATKGFLGMAINAHGIPNGQPGTFYAALGDGELKGYRTDGRESRDTYYFLGMYLRVKRALDFLMAQPEWDGKVLIINGGSQGGGQALAGAGLEPRVSGIVVMIPALCDLTGMAAGRIGGWPKPVPKDAEGKPDPVILNNMRYFDCVNFAPRIKAETKFWLGFNDVVTPPTGQYAAYNAITAPKTLITAPEYGHGGDAPNFWPMINNLIYDMAAQQQKENATP
ncbi:acetylxylan esterase [Spartobacteria bacterium LR76]|nr:acetylxylan esterase [Spartobacteria bacterium LR76]